MSQDYPLHHIDQYVVLPELDIPVVSSDEACGRLCRVLAVDFYLAAKSDCDERGIDAFEVPGVPRCALPAIVLEERGAATFHRLPNSLSVWIYELMRDPNYAAQFPATIEFGLRRDEYYARRMTPEAGSATPI